MLGYVVRFAGLLLLLLLLLAKQHRLFGESYTSHNKYEPQIALENNCELCGDHTVVMDKTVPFNRPDITLADKTNKQATFIDIIIPLSRKVQAKITEKQRKYQDLTFEIKQQWKMNEICVIEQVLSATGFIPCHAKSTFHCPYFTATLIVAGPQSGCTSTKPLFRGEKIPQ
jgi:hypothetical protein